ncbi:hypothetical protein [Pararhizobium gei]|nr:hypothetical protein [Rhizobium gei]
MAILPSDPGAAAGLQHACIEYDVELRLAQDREPGELREKLGSQAFEGPS